MKTLFKALFLLTFSCTLFAVDAKSTPIAQEHDEITKLDMLIQATENSLTRLKALKVLLTDYKAAEARAITNPNDTDNLLKLVNLAKQVQDSITDAELQDYFAPQFLEELKKFSEIANKKNIPQAK